MRGRSSRFAALVASAALLTAVGTYAPSAPASAARHYQWGINTLVEDNCSSAATWLHAAQTQMAAFASLDANAVAIAFPFYTGTSLRSNFIFSAKNCGTSYTTPSPGRLAVVVKAAHAAGLTVFLRPLLDETSLKTTPGSWRGVIHPGNPRLWFSNYFNTLRPYLAMSASRHVERFAISTELDSMARNPRWAGVISQARRIYHGNLTFTANWIKDGGEVVWPGTTSDIDTYDAVDVAPTATQAELLAGWNASSANNPLPYPISHATIDEVGIVAQEGAYFSPWSWSLPLETHPFNQAIQANWFTMVCSFVKQHQMKGVYFWGSWMTVRDGALMPTPNPFRAQDIQPQTQAAIKSCFQ